MANKAREFTDYELLLRGVLHEAIHAWPQLDLDPSQASDADLYINGSDMIEWFSEWRKTAITAIYNNHLPTEAAP